MKEIILTNAQIFSACNYIQEMDRNADILDFYQEYLNDEAEYETIVESLTSIFTEWVEDMLMNGLNEREKAILDSLNIRYDINHTVLIHQYTILNDSHSKLLHDYNQKVIELNEIKNTLRAILKETKQP